MIRLDHLSKRYGRTLAVDDVSFSVGAGEIVGFLGPNGAGKTTTLRMLTGFLRPTSGSVAVGGHDVSAEPMAAAKTLGYMPEIVPLYPEMRVEEYLMFRAELKGVARVHRRDRVARVLRDTSTKDVATTTIANLSKGYKQRVGLADALVADPPVLVLDEPTAGLDPNQIREVRDVICALGRERTVLLSTHILSEVEAICTRALVLAKGRLVFDGAVGLLAQQNAPRGVVVRCRPSDTSELSAFAKIVVTAAGPDAEVSVTKNADEFVADVTFASATDAAQSQQSQQSRIARIARDVIPRFELFSLVPKGSALSDVFRDLTAPVVSDDAADASEP